VLFEFGDCHNFSGVYLNFRGGVEALEGSWSGGNRSLVSPASSG